MNNSNIFTEVKCNPSLSLSAIAEKYKNDTSVLQINLDRSYTTNGSSLIEGIALLKWLRVKGNNHPIIVTSFLPLTSWLKMQPSNAILGSKGVAFIHLPNLIAAKLKNKHLELSDPSELKELFRIEFDLKKIRHEEANRYGLQKLVQCHKTVSGEDISTSINENLEDAIFDYCFNPQQSIYDSYKLQIAKNELLALRARKFYNEDNPIIPNVIYIDDQADKGWANFLRLLIYEKENDNDNFKVLFIDNAETKDTLTVKITDAINSFKDEKGEAILPSLIITDLKLLATENNLNSYDDYISTQAFRKIMTDYTINIPKKYNLKWLFFTASNNLILFKTLIKKDLHKPNAIFIKEGADMLFDRNQSLQNYIDLCDTLKMYFIKSPKKSKFNTDKLNMEALQKTYEIASKLDKINGKIPAFNFLDDKDFIVLDANIFLEFSNKMFSENQLENFIQFLIIFKDKIILNHAVRYELEAILEKEKKDNPENTISKTLILEWFLDFIKSIQLPIDEFKKDDYDNDEEKEEKADKFIIEIIQQKIKDNKKVVLLSLDRKEEKGKEGPAFIYDQDEYKNSVFVLPKGGHSKMQEFFETGTIATPVARHTATNNPGQKNQRQEQQNQNNKNNFNNSKKNKRGFNFSNKITKIDEDNDYYIFTFDNNESFKFRKYTLNEYQHNLSMFHSLISTELDIKNVSQFIKLIQSKLSKKQ
jgi:hypothetical protein